MSEVRQRDAVESMGTRAAPAHPASGDAAIEFGGRPLRLLPELAALDLESRTLLVADLHLDRSESLRRQGGAAPDGVLEETLSRLASAIERVGAVRVVVLGDLLHDARGPGPAIVERVSAWRAAHPIEIDLVGGNHDRAAARVCEAWSIAPLGAEAMLGRVRLRHEPPGDRAGDAASAPTIAGHLHPMAQIARGARRVLLPCFRFSGGVGVLPAFTRFARGVRFEPVRGQRLFAIAEGRVIELPQPPR